MRILITNNRLDLRGGAEAFVLDLARKLQEGGHEVVVYGSDPAQQERLLEEDAVPVTTNPERLPWHPDIIHGQHHLDAMTALASLPSVPALYCCHGAVWRETHPVHPRIYRYATISPFLKNRLVAESNIDPGRIDVVLNGIDPRRFPHVRQPGRSPARVLFFNGHHQPDSQTFVVAQRACQRLGLQFDAVGKHFARRRIRAETELPEYDIVFASGRSAMDAIACGCAVVVLGRGGCGPLLTAAEFDRFREANFSMAAHHPPPALELMCDQLERYDPEDARTVTRRMRAEATSDAMADQLAGIYGRIIREHEMNPPASDSDLVAMGRYLRRLTPLVKLVDDQAHVQLGHVKKLAVVRDLQHSLQQALTELQLKFPPAPSSDTPAVEGPSFPEPALDPADE